MDNTRVTVLIELIRQARAQTLKMVASVPETHRFKQLQEGKATPLWLLGHISRSMDRVLLEWMLEQPHELSEAQRQLFAPSMVGGTPPTTNPEDYPAWDEVVKLYETVTARAIEGLPVLTDADLDKPLPGDLPPNYRELFPTIGAALQRIVNHDAYHRGQMGLLARLS